MKTATVFLYVLMALMVVCLIAAPKDECVSDTCKYAMHY